MQLSGRKNTIGKLSGENMHKLLKMRSLAVISHTEHYYTTDGKVVGWEPTVRELNYLAEIFDLIYHIAPIHDSKPNRATASYKADNIIYVPIKPSGGKTLFNKIAIITAMFANLKIIIHTIQKVEWVHFRAPANIGIYVLPLLSIIKSKKKWIKYAGNWMKKDIPLSYSLQRWWLKKNILKSFVTINGQWSNQKKHLLSFANPCLTQSELLNANKIGIAKQFSGRLKICYVGRLDENKGIEKILLSLLNIGLTKHIKEINIVGDGPGREKCISLSKKILLSIVFHGWLSRSELNKIYAKSHVILLPTNSEGFPKVIAEACAFGCVPIVTNLPPINQFITNNLNGILFNIPSIQEITKIIMFLKSNREKLKKMSLLCLDKAKVFTYSKYLSSINKKILQG